MGVESRCNRGVLIRALAFEWKVVCSNPVEKATTGGKRPRFGLRPGISLDYNGCNALHYTCPETTRRQNPCNVFPMIAHLDFGWQPPFTPFFKNPEKNSYICPLINLTTTVPKSN